MRGAPGPSQDGEPCLCAAHHTHKHSVPNARSWGLPRTLGAALGAGVDGSAVVIICSGCPTLRGTVGTRLPSGLFLTQNQGHWLAEWTPTPAAISNTGPRAALARPSFQVGTFSCISQSLKPVSWHQLHQSGPQLCVCLSPGLEEVFSSVCLREVPWAGPPT